MESRKKSLLRLGTAGKGWKSPNLLLPLTESFGYETGFREGTAAFAKIYPGDA